MQQRGVTRLHRLLALHLLCLLAASLGACPLAASRKATSVKLIATRDVWVSAHPDELDTSMGKTPELKLKGNTEVALLDFDVSGLRGKRVTAAELWVHNVPEAAAREKARLGLDPGRADCLRKIGLSTIGSQWEEGAQADTYRPDPEGHGATYNQASYQRRDWAYSGSKLWDVVMGNGHSLHCHAERQYQGDDWWKVPVEPRLVAAMIAALSHGLLLEEESGGSIDANNYIHSRESGEHAPYLVVTAVEGEQSPPGPPRQVSLCPAPEFATLTHGASRVELAVPTGAFGYLVSVNGLPVAPWRVPYAAPAGRAQSFVLEDLAPDEELTVEVRAVSGTGLTSSAVVVRSRASEARLDPPALPSSPFLPTAGPPPAAGPMKVWAYPEVTKVDPISGEALFEPRADLRQANAVWDGGAALVRLSAARGEIAAFQLAVEAASPLQGLRLEMSDLRGGRGAIPRQQIRPFRVWYVSVAGKWQPEYAIPLLQPFELPASDNGVPGQTVQSLYIDVIIPQDTVPGSYRGTLTVSGEGAIAVSLDLELVVYPAVIPRHINFSPELNCYAPPGGQVGSPYFYAAHRLAHYHRCAINTVPYSQSGRMTEGYAPVLAGQGAEVRVSDWSDFDRLVGPLLDGSAFLGNPRSGVPVRAFYLPFFEHWPLSLWDHYPIKGSPKDEAAMVENMLSAPPIEEALPPAYVAAFQNVVRQFVSHCDEKGWSETDFQMYLNNKHFWGGTFWTLDEPVGRDDWQALRYWAQLFKGGTEQARQTRFVFRGDISRPWWQYDQLDELMDTIYYNNEIFDFPGFARTFNRRIPDPHVYGGCNEISASNHQSALWCLKAYALGLNGVLPWQSLGEASALKEPDTNGLIVPGTLAGYDGPVASLRVFALRRGAQDVELLRLLAQEKAYSRDQIAALISQKLPLGAEFRQGFADEAAGLAFGQISAQDFADLREGVLLLLTP